MKRILLIDDEEATCAELNGILTGAGFDVVTAADGRDGMALFRQQDIDLVITDLIMPNQDGFETIMALRHLRPDCRIIAISGGGRRVEIGYLEKVVRRMGVIHFLPKPVSREEILAAVNDLLKDAGPPG
jgi:DNA-binding response OmpR family regulator